jgi:hypothetical protein
MDFEDVNWTEITQGPPPVVSLLTVSNLRVFMSGVA